MLDLLVLGSGVAGLSAAVQAARRQGARVGVLTKGELSQTATRWAQGGVAAVLGGDPDSTDLHLADTLAAGAGLCDVDAVRVLVDEGPGRVQDLIALGAVFDKEAGGGLALAREGGHSVARVVHAGGAATGAEIERALVDAVRATAASVMERWFAVDLLVEGGRCRGILALDPAGRRTEVRARHTLLATGGAGQLYAVTTNPDGATGDGVAMALRAGVVVADLEFVQFHPTALHHPQVPRPLLSEALRGHGALLRDDRGERFVDELQPRDVVARAMTRRMLEHGVDHLWLDATGLGRFGDRFPTIAAALTAAGLDPASDWLPIAPAAHYMIGGVLTDLDGSTTLPGLWAAGEAACTGVHGANRLASNSLLEGMVFGARVVEAVAAGREGPQPTGAMKEWLGGTCLRVPSDEGWFGHVRSGGEDPAKLRAELGRAMTTGAGVLRDRESLSEASAVLGSLSTEPAPGDADGPDSNELRNLITVGQALVRAALAREETRGCHTRSDFPIGEARFEKRLVAGGPDPQPPRHLVRAAVARALEEDLGPDGDLTSALLPRDVFVTAILATRADGVLAGRAAAIEAFAQVDKEIQVNWRADDGDLIEHGENLAEVYGPMASVLTAERTALNFLCHLSGVATLTRLYVDLADGRAAIRDTRKTTPGLRALEKAAVRAGGGLNHRFSLSDGILVKDNHLAWMSIEEAVAAARARWPGVPLQVECDSADQVARAVDAGAGLVLLDNMSPAQVAECVETVAGRVLVEVSGGVTLANVAAYAATGADLISVGALTHSAPALDIGLDL
ncbi:MAG: L-aspartate oxidase [Acidimicrobiales bacterium]